MPGGAADPGPIKVVTAFGQKVPCYAITFDKQGDCTSPQSAQHLVAALAGGAASDVIVYSHGWNTVFDDAVRAYDAFLAGVSAMAAAHPQQLPAGFNPVFVGIHWPSTSLVAAGERTPQIAADPVAASHEREAVLDAVEPGGRAEAAALIDRAEGLSDDQARRLAELLVPSLTADPDIAEAGPNADDLLAMWREPVQAQSGLQGGFSHHQPAAGPIEEVRPAGLLDAISPRRIVRLASVLIMKDRAGVVGATGVSALVSRILGKSDARLFLVGHSYGCKVIGAALAAANAPRQAEGMLMLQPAVNRLCFAANRGDGVAGGFRGVLQRVRQPVFCTWSSHDFPLRQVFHIVARRASDLGEVRAAAVSRFAALGGYGPGELGSETIEWPLPRTPSWPPAPPPAVKVMAFDGSASIDGHGDVGNPAVFWTMLNLLHPTTEGG